MAYNYSGMRPFLIATIMLAAVAYFAPRRQGKQYTTHAQYQANGQLSAASSQIHSQAETKSANDDPPHWYKSPEWILVIVGTVTAFVIGWQSYEAMNAARAANTTAEAAKKNIAAMISKERARLRIESVKLHLVNPPWTRTEYDRIELKIVRHGTIPASILQAWTNIRVSKTPEFPTVDTLCIPISTPGMIGIDIAEIPQEVPIVEAEELIKDSARFFLHFLVFIRYRDVFQAATHWEITSRYTWNVNASRGVLSWGQYAYEDKEQENSAAN